MKLPAKKRDIVLIGTSAGGMEPLKRVVSGLAEDLAAAVFVIVHIPPWHRSVLPSVLSRWGRLPAKNPAQGEFIRPGQIYVAPPDHHMLLEDDGRIQLWRGPKENRHRPAINASFRSAAVNFRDRVVGVVLSGMLEDGAAGLWWIKRFGGVAMVQDPGETQFPDMPYAALEYVAVDYVVPAAEMSSLIVDLSNGKSETARAYGRGGGEGHAKTHTSELPGVPGTVDRDTSR